MIALRPIRKTETDAVKAVLDVVFQACGISPGKEVFRYISMKVKQHRMGCIFAFNEHPLLYPIDVDKSFFRYDTHSGYPFSSPERVCFPSLLCGKMVVRITKQEIYK